MTPEPPKKPSEIIKDHANRMFADVPKTDENTDNINLAVLTVVATLKYLDSQQDAYTTGYNQALKDMEGKLIAKRIKKNFGDVLTALAEE